MKEDLPGVDEHKGVIALDVEIKPNQKGDLLEPGTYRFTLKLGAANCEPRTHMLWIVFTGLWDRDEHTMFQNFKITTAPPA